MGPVNGALFFLVVFLSFIIKWLIKTTIKSKDKEIDRMAADNRKYREVYLLEIVKMNKGDYNKIMPPDDGLKSRKKQKGKMR